MAEKKVIAELRTIANDLMDATVALMKADTDNKGLNDQLKDAATATLNIAATLGKIIIDVRHLPAEGKPGDGE